MARAEPTTPAPHGPAVALSPAARLARSASSTPRRRAALLAPGSVGRAVRARWATPEATEAAARLSRHARGAAVRSAILNLGARRARVCRPVWSALQAHQLSGVRWCAATLAEAGGGILSDDPGLGKTLSAIALVRA